MIIITILHKLFQNKEKKVTNVKSFYGQILSTSKTRQKLIRIENPYASTPNRQVTQLKNGWRI